MPGGLSDRESCHVERAVRSRELSRRERAVRSRESCHMRLSTREAGVWLLRVPRYSYCQFVVGKFGQATSYPGDCASSSLNISRGFCTVGCEMTA